MSFHGHLVSFAPADDNLRLREEDDEEDTSRHHQHRSYRDRERPPPATPQRVVIRLTQDHIIRTDTPATPTTPSPTPSSVYSTVKNLDIEDPNVLDIRNFECSICLQLFYDPHVGLCGHTFCLKCLYDLEKFDTSCPLCRQPLGKPAQSHPNVLVKYLMQKHFPVEFEQRKKTAATEGSDGLRLVLRAQKSNELTDGAESASGRIGRAVLPFIQSLMPLAYDLVIVMSALIYVRAAGSGEWRAFPRRDRLL